MKTLLMTAALALAAIAAAAGEREARIEVGGMTCVSCPYIAASALKSVESVRIAGAVYDQSAAIAVFTVLFDDVTTTAEAIAAAPGVYGYTGRVLADGGS